MPDRARLDAPAPDASGSLEDREAAVLAELAREAEATVAFQGLRRRLELHQEALSRTLRRLELQGYVQHDEQGYRLTEQGFAALRGRPRPGEHREVLALAQAVLPPHLTADAVAEALSRRWFRGLRWYGRSGGPGETTLLWLSEPGNAMVKVRVGAGAVVLETEVVPGAPARTFAPARAVLAALAELYGVELGPSGPANTFGDGPGFAA